MDSNKNFFAFTFFLILGLFFVSACDDAGNGPDATAGFKCEIVLGNALSADSLGGYNGESINIINVSDPIDIQNLDDLPITAFAGYNEDTLVVLGAQVTGMDTTAIILYAFLKDDPLGDYIIAVPNDDLTSTAFEGLFGEIVIDPVPTDIDAISLFVNTQAEEIGTAIFFGALEGGPNDAFTITKFDTVNGLISGTFQYDYILTETGEKLIGVTNGSFTDLQLIEGFEFN